MPVRTERCKQGSNQHTSGGSGAVATYPEQHWHWGRYVLSALFLLSFSYLCLFRSITTIEPDEGILLQGAERILSGQVLYRDFFSFYTPGSYYTLALLFRAFGSSIVVARTALALTGAILSAVTYLLARRVCSHATALTIAALTTVTTLPYRFLILHNWDSTLLAVLALYCAVQSLESPKWKWSFALGTFASLTVLFEQSKGMGLCLGLGIGFLSIFLMQGRRPLLSRVQLLTLASGLAWPFVITFIYFASQHTTSIMLADWFWPLQHYSTANRVPYGYQNWSDESRHLLFATGSLFERQIKFLAISPCFWIPVLPLVATGLLIYWIIQARWQCASEQKFRYYIIVSAALTGLWLSTIVVRADIIHLMYLQPLNCLVLGWLLESGDYPIRVLRPMRLLIGSYVVIALLAFGLAPLFGAVTSRNKITTRRGVIRTQGKDNVVDLLQARVPAGETILVYPYLPLYYYVTDTFSPSRFDYFQPGMNTEEQAGEMIRQVAERHVKVVLFEIGFAEKIPHSWPGTPMSVFRKDPVADYIVRNYRACEPLQSPAGWRFLYMVPKELSCP
jgi:4-amino-4-deoxy-L-arabinose transferase-like glycosyltransferase